MCRLSAYLGKEIDLETFLRAPEHSLIKQSWEPEQMYDAKMNADGYGLAWLNSKSRYHTYKSLMPIWSDHNLDGLCSSLSSTTWLGYVRSATPGQGLNILNTQPFIQDNIILLHNGCFTPFDQAIKIALLKNIDLDIQTDISGDTDSLYLFALIRTMLKKTNDMHTAIQNSMMLLNDICQSKYKALLNLIILYQQQLYLCCHAINERCPTLYYLQDEQSIKVASEPLTPKQPWHKIADHKLMHMDQTTIFKQQTL